MITSRRQYTTDRGFSFVELLAYMAIAALLILAAIPQFNSHRNQAYDTLVKGDLKSMAAAYEAYAIDGQAYPTSVAAMRAGLITPVGTKAAYGAADRITQLVCTDGKRFNMFGFSRSGRVFTYDSTGTMGTLPRTTPQTGEHLCATLNGYAPASGYWTSAVWPTAGK